MIEIWKIIENWEDYEISNYGRVRRKKTAINNKRWKVGRVLRPQSNGNYLFICLHKNGIKKRFYIHRLVLMAFNREPLKDEEGNHKDGNKLNNYMGNLEWLTHSENEKHAHRIGLKVGIGCPGRVGTLHPLHKLKDGEVWLIKKLSHSKLIPQSKIAKMFNVGQTAISKINRGLRWGHIIYNPTN